MLSATDRRKHSLEATAGKNKKVLREAWIDLDHSSAAEEMFRINLLVRRRCAGFELVRIPAAAAAVLRSCRAAGGSFLFLLCDAQVCFASGRLMLLHTFKDDLAGSSVPR